MWYSWQAPVTGPVTIDTEGSDFDTLLGAYTGNALNALTEVASNDDSRPGVDQQSQISFQATQGTTYRIAVDGFNDQGQGPAKGNLKLSLTQAGTGPANDNFANSIALSGASPSRQDDTNVGATEEGGEPDHAGNPGGASVWYSWTAPGDGAVTADTVGSNFDTLLAVYTGSAVNGLTPVASNDDINPGVIQQSQLSFQATQGTTYRIAVDGYNDQGAGAVKGSLDLHLSQQAAGPSNNSFANAHVLSGADDSITGDSNVGATKEGGEPDHTGNPGGASVWYQWTAPTTDPVTIETVGSDFDTLLAAYTGGSVGALTEMDSNDDLSPGHVLQSRVSFQATQGVTYRIAVDGYSRPESPGPATGSVEITLHQGADNQPPDTEILSGPSGRIHKRKATFSFDSPDDPAATFECQMDSFAVQECSSAWQYRHLPNGRHTFTVTAVDAASNADPTPAQRSFKVKP